jgi:hypothetical protein
VATRVGISRETLCQWRSQDADLDRQLDEARAEAAELAWKQIMKAGESGGGCGVRMAHPPPCLSNPVDAKENTGPSFRRSASVARSDPNLSIKRVP